MKLNTFVLCVATAVVLMGCGQSGGESSEPPPKISAESESAAKAARDEATRARANEKRIVETAQSAPQPSEGTPGTVTIPADMKALDEQIKKEAQ